MIFAEASSSIVKPLPFSCGQAAPTRVQMAFWFLPRSLTLARRVNELLALGPGVFLILALYHGASGRLETVNRPNSEVFSLVFLRVPATLPDLGMSNDSAIDA
jgi:hypothetical protein